MNDERIDMEEKIDEIEQSMAREMQEMSQIRYRGTTTPKYEKDIQEPIQKQSELGRSKVNDFKTQMQKYKNFEEYRNNTSFFDMNEQWLQLVSNHYQNNPGRKILQYHQFATVMYMAGQFMSRRIQPRGLLLFHIMGSGKTLANIASGFYCLSRVPLYTEKSKIIFICNKAIQIQIQNEISKYVSLLNKYKIDETFQPQKSPLNPEQYLARCSFITFNDSVSLNQKLMSSFDVIQNAFVIFDEAHNLFKSIGNEATRGNQIYHHLMSKNLQIQFNSGTPFSSDMSELGICFNILSGNPNLFPVSSLNSLFIEASPEADEQQYIKNKQVLMRRIVGLVSSAEIDIENEHYPKMKSLELIQVPISPEYLSIYIDTRKSNLKSQKFMSDSHLLDNGHIATDGKVISNKFKTIKENIELDPTPQIIYSQFVTRGTILFAEYCLQENKNPKSKYIWKQFDLKLYQQQQKQKNELIFALVHGNIESTERMEIISVFNSPQNVNGDIINVICLSKASVEGINIKYIRKVHIMEAQWETRDLQQVMSRGQRMYSHSLLPIEQRSIQPYIYISYISDQKYAFTKDAMNMSTDQQIYFKQQSLVPFQNSLFTLLHFVSFNCANLNQFTYMDQLFKPDFHKACFKCEATNQQLFNPKFIHQDISINNCRTPVKSHIPLQFTLNDVIYGVIVDIYSPFGFIIFEYRDKYRKPIDTKVPNFQQLFVIAKQTVQKYAKKGVIITNQEALEDITQSQLSQSITTQFMPYIVISQVSETEQFRYQQKAKSRLLLGQIRASILSFNMQMFDQFRIFTKLEHRNNIISQQSSKLYTLFQLFDIFVVEKKESTNWQLTSLYVLNDIQYNFNEFFRRIVKPFYIYLIEYIYIDIRINIKSFFDHFKQVIIFFNKKNATLLELIEFKLHKTLLRNMISTE